MPLPASVWITVAAVVVASAVAGYLALQGRSDAPKGSISGTVLVGPTCPVERDPPDPACADKPLAADLVLVSGDGERELLRFRPDAAGAFTLKVAAGAYLIRPATSGPPACDAAVQVIAARPRSSRCVATPASGRRLATRRPHR